MYLKIEVLMKIVVLNITMNSDFSQNAQRLPDSPEVPLMDTSGASLKRKKSKLAFKEAPPGRTCSRYDEPQRKEAGPSFSPSPVQGFTRGRRLLVRIALVGSDLILYFSSFNCCFFLIPSYSYYSFCILEF